MVALVTALEQLDAQQPGSFGLAGVWRARSDCLSPQHN